MLYKHIILCPHTFTKPVLCAFKCTEHMTIPCLCASMTFLYFCYSDPPRAASIHDCEWRTQQNQTEAAQELQGESTGEMDKMLQAVLLPSSLKGHPWIYLIEFHFRPTCKTCKDIMIQEWGFGYFYKRIIDTPVVHAYLNWHSAVFLWWYKLHLHNKKCSCLTKTGYVWHNSAYSCWLHMFLEMVVLYPSWPLSTVWFAPCTDCGPAGPHVDHGGGGASSHARVLHHHPPPQSGRLWCPRDLPSGRQPQKWTLLCQVHWLLCDTVQCRCE